MAEKKGVVEGYPGKSETRIQPANYFLNSPCKGKKLGAGSQLEAQNDTILIYEGLIWCKGTIDLFGISKAQPVGD
jgi:hypothetical protein